MTRKRKKKMKVGPIILVLIIAFSIVGYLYYNSRPKLKVVSIVSKIENYGYYLEDNATRIYKDNYNKLEKELSKEEVDEDEYAKLVAKMFVIDYYTLNNKVTNKDIGGVQFVHSALKEAFISKASETIYKYVENDLYGNRKQKLPEVKSVEIKDSERIKYKAKDYFDNNGYAMKLEVKYKKDYDYPKEVSVKIIHENNKLVIVEIK